MKLKPFYIFLIVGAIHLLCASLSFAASMTDQTSSAYSLNWRAGLAGVSSQDTQSSSKFVSFGLDAQLNYWLAPTIFMNLEPKMKFENGSFQSLDGDRKNETGVYINEAAAHWMFANGSTLAAGALDQSTSHTDLLVGRQAFPATRLRWQALKFGDIATTLEAEEAIPTSSSLATNTTGVETTPGFSSASVTISYQPNSQYYWRNRIGAYRYDNLPSSVAYESSLRGNTVQSLTQSEALFIYDYQGLEASSDFRLPVMRGWDFYSGVSYLQNTKAIDNYNKAYSATAGSEFYLLGRKSLEVALTSFRVEPDAAVAYFNSLRYFNTNRIGYNVETFMNFRKYGFRVGVSYTEAELIYVNPVQSREKNWMLFLETAYASI